MFNQIKHLSAAAALFVAMPAIASAQNVAYGTAPVSITSCDVAPTTDRLSFVGPISYGSMLLRASNDIALDYVNTTDVAATSVTFVVNAGNKTQSIVAKGSFAPGANIAQTFTSNDTYGSTTNAACSVAAVRFADGHVWQAAPGVVSSR